MIEVECKYSSLHDLIGLPVVELYKSFINPIDYEFDLIKNKKYFVLSIILMDSLMWIYVSPFDDALDIQLIPAVLFDFKYSAIPYNWVIRRVREEPLNIEILPKKLYDISNWYEKYIDEDKSCLSVIMQMCSDVIESSV